MAEIENFVFKDPEVKPTDELLFSVIGDKSRLWKNIMGRINEQQPDISSEWRYYNDGKQWLFKMTRKKKTICWIGILQDTFRITFYFGDKAEPLIENSDLPETIKGEFRTAKHYGRIRGISVKMTDDRDIDNILKLVALKVKAA